MACAVRLIHKVHATLYKMDSVDKREKCLQRKRERERSRRASETAEEREERLRKRRVRDRARRAAQSASAREIDLQQRRERSATESPESREARLQRMRDRVAAETDEEREVGLQQMRDRLAAETSEEQEGRLQQMSDRQRDRLVAETVEEREARLQQMRDRLATETVEEREARLQQMRDRLPTETVEEREARLQQMSDHQRDWLAAETPEQRQAGLHHRSQRPLFEQPCVQTKMAKFHAHMSTLDISTCTCTNMNVTAFQSVLNTIAGPNITPEKILDTPKLRFVKNTQRNNTWALKLFQEWRVDRNKRSEKLCPEDLLDNPDPKKLNHWLSRFVTEVRKQDGQPYPPKTIHHILAALQRIVVGKQPTTPKFMDRNELVFTELCRTCDSVYRQ